MNVTPSCDCWNFSTAPIVNDIGFLASLDPIAIDQAAADLVNRSTAASQAEKEAPDKFLALTGNRWDRQLEDGEELGLGTRDYELVRIGD